MSPFASPAISRTFISRDVEDVNTSCHGSTVAVTGHSKHIMAGPSVILILWDNLFVNNSTAVSTVEQLVQDLITGPFMNGLAQYGVARGTLLNTVTLDTQTYPAPSAWDSSQIGTADFNQLKAWFADTHNSKLTAPPENENQLLYLIILPNTTQLTNGTSNGITDTSVGGWHYFGKTNAGSSDNDTYWAVVKTIGSSLSAGKEKEFVNGFSRLVGHELIEAFTDRDADGYFSQVQVSPTQSVGCEIGDICEAQPDLIYRGWNVEPYWSNWDSACIRGDAPVSLSRFCTAINFDASQNSLSALGTGVINLDFVASRMR